MDTTRGVLQVLSAGSVSARTLEWYGLREQPFATGAHPRFAELDRTRRDALAEMLAVQGLLLFQGTPFNRQIPAKIYEYFRARKPIFGLLDLSGDTANVLRIAGFHDLANMDAAEEIALALKSFIQKIRDGQAHIASDEVVAASSRKHRARQLAQVFDELTEPPNSTFLR